MAVFSKLFPDIVNVILTECYVCPLNGGKPFHTEKSMWDTGSEYTLVSSRIIKELGLQPCGRAGIGGIGGDVVANTYYVHLGLPSGDVIAYLEVVESEYEDYDVIIGMDVISNGDFHIDNSSGHSEFTFTLP